MYERLGAVPGAAESELELVSELETVAGAVVTESSVVGNKVPFAFTGGTDGPGAEATTLLSVVGKSGGALAEGAGELEVSAVCGSGFSGSVGAVELFFSAACCCSFTCCCNVWTISL